MLMPEEVKPLLIHEDRYIREAACDYFHDTYSRDGQILPLLLESRERYGVPMWRRPLVDAYRYACDESAFDRVLSTLATATQGDRTAFDLSRVLMHVSPALLAARRTEWESHPCLDGDFRRVIERRLEFAGWSAEDLWQALQDFVAESESERYVGRIDHEKADSLVAALAQHEYPSGEAICEMLREADEGKAWLEIFLVDLAGARRLKAAIPAVVEKYCIDTSYLLDRATVALAKIGDVDAIRLVRSRYCGAARHFRRYGRGVYAAILHEASEEALLEALAVESDASIRTMLCCDLCKLFSARGVEAVLEEIRNGYDELFDRLEDRVLPVADVLGIELPEGDAWRAAREDEERRRLDGAEGLAEWGGKRSDRQRLKVVAKAIAVAFRHREEGLHDDEATDVGADYDADYEAEDGAFDSSIAPPAPIRKAAAKVGRNDPCPCGSGKKFKKCCG